MDRSRRYTLGPHRPEASGAQRAPRVSTNHRSTARCGHEQAALREVGGVRVSPPGCREPLRALGHEAVDYRGRASPSGWVGSRYRQVRAASFLPAVPPACHKQRSPAVSSGQSRSLEGGRWAGLNGSDLGWGRRPKLHGMQGVRGKYQTSGSAKRRAGGGWCSRRVEPASQLPGDPTKGISDPLGKGWCLRNDHPALTGSIGTAALSPVLVSLFSCRKHSDV
jgi:hypothetical protein